MAKYEKKQLYQINKDGKSPQKETILHVEGSDELNDILNFISGSEVIETSKIDEEEKIDDAQKKGKFGKGKVSKGKLKNKSVKENPKKDIIPKNKLKNYSKTKLDSSYEEMGEDGRFYYYFDIEKTIKDKKMDGITKIIPMDTLKNLTENKILLDNYAAKKHKKIEKYNSSTPEEQYKYDKGQKNKKILALCIVVILFVLNLTLNTIPKNNYNSATNYLFNGDYNEAYVLYENLGSYKNSPIYARFCDGKISLFNKEYDKAKEIFESLLPYKDSFDTKFDIEECVMDADYQKALNFYSTGDYANAKDIFKSIYKYSESTEYYYKSQYKIANGYYEEGDYENAFIEFSKAKKHQDGEARFTELGDFFYDDAFSLYKEENYNEAKDIFALLSKYSFKDSKDMVLQCNYRYGLDLYKNNNYPEAINVLSTVSKYKDSYAMIRDCTYKIGNEKYNSSPAQSLEEYMKIPTYKDVSSKLLMPTLVLYGEWNITEINGSKTSDIKFSFNENNNFITNKQILGIAISTEANPIQYTWNEETFVLEEYNIRVEATNFDNIKIICSNGNAEYVYTCNRIKTLMELNNTDENGDIVNAEKTSEKLIHDFLQEYVDSKYDGIIFIGEKEYDINSLKKKNVEIENN